MAATSKFRDDFRPEIFLDVEPAGIVGVRREGVGEALRGNPRRLHRLLHGHAVLETFKKTCSMPCDCWSPPGVPKVMNSLPSLNTIAGLGVSRGRLPGFT